MEYPAHRPTLVDRVVQQLRQLITSGQIQPGEFLPPRKTLAARFGVGLSTIHEAVQALAAVGMVSSHPGVGTWVREDAFETLIPPTLLEARLGDLNARQIYEARSVIEVALTEFAAQRATPEAVERIQTALQAMEAAGDNLDLFVEADLEFHLAVARAGQNELLEQFYHLARTLLSEIITEMVKLPNVKEEAIRLQRAIAQAIEHHNPSQARRAALKHMRSVEHILNTLDVIADNK
jgi:GntR family transcriptional repressor for pyruvate dehydrogenase complex